MNFRNIIGFDRKNHPRRLREALGTALGVGSLFAPEASPPPILIDMGGWDGNVIFFF